MASGPNVVIVGGGIGGLFAANALIAQGLRVAVYDGHVTLILVIPPVALCLSCTHNAVSKHFRVS